MSAFPESLSFHPSGEPCFAAANERSRIGYDWAILSLNNPECLSSAQPRSHCGIFFSATLAPHQILCRILPGSPFYFDGSGRKTESTGDTLSVYVKLSRWYSFGLQQKMMCIYSTWQMTRALAECFHKCFLFKKKLPLYVMRSTSALLPCGRGKHGINVPYGPGPAILSGSGTSSWHLHRWHHAASMQLQHAPHLTSTLQHCHSSLEEILTQ